MSGYIGTQPVPQATQTRDSFTATSGQTSFATGGYTPNFLDVYLNGVKLASADYTASNGSDVVLASGAATGDILEVVAFTTFNSASSSIDDNGNATALTIDSSENVLVGKASADSNSVGIELHSNDIIKVTRSGGATGYFNRQTSDGNILELAKDGTSVGSIGTTGGDFYLTKSGSNQTGIYFNELGMLPMNSGSIADNSKDIGQSGYRFKDAYLSGGIHLGGTGSTNRLDDYEQGTWTPVISGTSSSGTGTYSSQTGTYIKVGKLVHITCRVTWTAHTGSGGFVLNGWPFTSSSSNQTGFHIMSNNMNMGGTNKRLSMHLGASSGDATLFNTEHAVAWSTPSIDASADIIFNGTYTAN